MNKYTATQIASFLRLAEMGRSVEDLCRVGGFDRLTFDRWYSRYSGLSVDDLACVRKLEAELTLRPLPAACTTSQLAA